MIGIVVVAHERIASEMKRAVEHVLGEQPLFEAVDVLDSNAVEVVCEQLNSAVQQCDGGCGVMMFTDMFGSTPCNIALAQMQTEQCEIISGMNLPMLIKAASKRKQAMSLKALAQLTEKAGKQYVCLISELNAETSEAGHG